MSPWKRRFLLKTIIFRFQPLVFGTVEVESPHKLPIDGPKGPWIPLAPRDPQKGPFLLNVFEECNPLASEAQIAGDLSFFV